MTAVSTSQNRENVSEIVPSHIVDHICLTGPVTKADLSGESCLTLTHSLGSEQLLFAITQVFLSGLP